jgi:2-methylcitrate dehydratase PrpD
VEVVYDGRSAKSTEGGTPGEPSARPIEGAPAGAAGHFIDHALSLRWAAVAEPVRVAAKTFLHDTLCVGVAGVDAPHAGAIFEVASAWGEGGACTVLGRPGVRLPAPSAAFVNAFQIHSQEFDCVHEAAVLHPLATAVAALRAQAERGDACSGEDFLISLIVGVDVAVALGLAPTTPLKFFRPATAGVFGSVAALARLRRLDRETALDAFGYALAFASGTMQAHVEGKPALPVQVANAARAAIVAVDLAVAGVKGPRLSIDGPFGYLPLFEDAHDLAPILRDLPGVRRIAEVSWKPFPTGRAAHGGLVAVERLMQAHEIAAGGLEALEFRAPPLIRRLVGRPAKAGMEVAYARLCLPWLAAVALTRGEVGLGDFTPERLADPDILALASRITVVEDGSRDPAAFTPLVATARARSGDLFVVEIASMLGAPATPLTPDQHMEKARRCLAHAGFEAAHGAFAAAVMSLDSALDAAAALRLPAPEARMG